MNSWFVMFRRLRFLSVRVYCVTGENADTASIVLPSSNPSDPDISTEQLPDILVSLNIKVPLELIIC